MFISSQEYASSRSLVASSFWPHLLAPALFNRVPKSPFQPLSPLKWCACMVPVLLHEQGLQMEPCVSTVLSAPTGHIRWGQTNVRHELPSSFLTKGVSLCRRSISVKISGSESWKKKSPAQWMSEQMFTTPLGQWKQCKQLFQIETILLEFLGYTTQLQVALFQVKAWGH